MNSTNVSNIIVWNNLITTELIDELNIIHPIATDITVTNKIGQYNVLMNL